MRHHHALSPRCVSAQRIADSDLEMAIQRALDGASISRRLRPGLRVAVKPNLTYPYHKRGVTTQPAFIRAVTKALADHGVHTTIVESDGGYGAWKAEDAFAGHGLYELEREFGCTVRSLHDGPQRPLQFRAHGRSFQLSMPALLLDETDLLLTLPVPKIHCMTGLTLSYKNQWGCVPDPMRMRRHHVFDQAIVAINQLLRPAVLADGAYFLDDNGPMDGTVVPMGLVIGATDCGAFDLYTSALMGWDWRSVSHLRRAVRTGDMPGDLRRIEHNISPTTLSTRRFRLRRTARNWIALSGFRSRTVTWFGYESWFGRTILHGALYAIAGKPPSPSATQPHPNAHAPAQRKDSTSNLTGSHDSPVHN